MTEKRGKKKEKSFNFLRLHPKQPVEPLVTPPATPLSFPAPKRLQSSSSRAESVVSRFRERLELPSAFHETAVSQLDRAEILRPLSPHPLGGSGSGSSSGVGFEREEEGIHPYVRTLVYGVVESSHGERYDEAECERRRMGGFRWIRSITNMMEDSKARSV